MVRRRTSRPLHLVLCKQIYRNHMGPAPALVVGLPMSTLQQEYYLNHICQICIGSLDRNNRPGSFHSTPRCDLVSIAIISKKKAYRWRATLSICTACATKLGAARIAIAGYFGCAVPICRLTISSTIIGRITTVSAEVSSLPSTDGY